MFKLPSVFVERPFAPARRRPFARPGLALAAAALSFALGGCGGSADAPPPSEAGGVANVAPTITLQPADAAVVAPAVATFSAAASGAPAPSVQWQQSRDAGTTWTAIAGATSASFTTPATTLADSGSRYRAVFSNVAGSATSSAATLTVTAAQTAGVLSLLAGDIGGNGTIDGTGVAARFGKIDGLVTDAAGNVYVADTSNQTIRKITPSGVVTTLAGLGGARGTADGQGAAARFSDPWGIVIDSAGNLYVSDFSNNLIRKITPAGLVTTLAGGGTGSGVDGTGAAARFAGPLGLAIDATGTLYVADEFNHTIRKVTPAGVVTTFVGRTGVAGDVDGSATGARLNTPVSLAIDAAGTLYVGEGTRLIRAVSPFGNVSTLAGSPSGGHADGTGAAATFSDPRGLAVDAAGNVLVADTGNCLLRRVTPAGVVTTIAGVLTTCSTADGPAASATFNQPQSLATDAAGNVYVGGDSGFVVRKLTSAGQVSTLAGAPSRVGDVDGSGTAARFAIDSSGFGGIGSTGVDAAGNVYVGDFNNGAVRKVSSAGVVTTLSNAVRGPTGLTVDAAGNVYVGSVAELLKITPAGAVSSLAGGGLQGSADGTGAAASFGTLDAIAHDAAGNLYVADGINNTVRKVSAAGVVTTLAGTAGVAGHDDGSGAAATFSAPSGIAVDAAGNVFVADSGNATIRKITPAGAVTTIAGTPGTSGSADGTGAAASFAFPYSMAVDSAGNLYVSDLYANNVRKVTPAGVVTTLIGKVNEVGVRLGSDPRLAFPTGLSLSGDHLLVVVSANAVLTYSLP